MLNFISCDRSVHSSPHPRELRTVEEGTEGAEDERGHDFYHNLLWVGNSNRELVSFPGGPALTMSEALDTWGTQGDSGGSVHAIRHDHRPVLRTTLQLRRNRSMGHLSVSTCDRRFGNGLSTLLILLPYPSHH